VTSKGYSLLEVLVALTIMVVIGGAAIPIANGGIDRSRAAGAARYVAGRMALARFEAVRRSACVAIRFLRQDDGYQMQAYVDGNRNGVLAADVMRGIDVQITAVERLGYSFPGVEFGIQPNVSGIDPGPFDATDPVQIGSSAFLSFSPTGSSTSGTLFIRNHHGHQFAVRILGATGRTRVLEFNAAHATWLGR
jgi:prepilin-type N-terminal cleavage/methylation domain-containing protein